METSQTVYIVDDDEAIRDGIKDLVESMDCKAKAYPSGEEFLQNIPKDPQGCCVLDIRMPGISGLDVQQTLIEKDICLPVVIITGHGDIPMAVNTVKAGAVDFIEKPFREQALWNAIQKALNIGEKSYQKHQKIKSVMQKYNSLTERELQVLDRILDGQSDKEIAQELNVTQRAVAFHRNHIFRKMEVETAVDLLKKINLIHQPA